MEQNLSFRQIMRRFAYTASQNISYGNAPLAIAKALGASKKQTMKYKKFIYLLLGSIILLVLVDIFTGIFYWNRLNLFFNSSNFNNITSPIIGLISLIVYSMALFLAFDQNKIILSQHLKPYFEREINELKIKFKNKQLDISLIETEMEDSNGLNYPSLIFEQLTKLTKDKNYNEDLEESKNGKEFPREYFMTRTYYQIIVFLSNFTIGFTFKFEFNSIKELIEEIEESRLLNIDKKQFKKRIKRELLMEYISFIRFEDSAKNFVPAIPILFDPETIRLNYIEFKRISETSFRDPYKWIRKKL